MTDITFPAHLVVTEEVDDNGLPVLTAVVDPADNFAEDSLPAGNRGPAGPRGVPGPTFVKMGEIEDAEDRPLGLGPTDRGKWWHRLDDDGMDLWDGSAWVHSPDAVGPQGPVADANTLTVTTVHDPVITLAAADIAGNGAAQALTVTAPAGLRGPAGPAGDSGAIGTATDFDTSTAPTLRSTFGLSAGGNRWLVQNPPNGFGPWNWYNTDFETGSTSITADSYVMGTFTIPPLPFRWRPLAYGHIHAGAAPGTGTYPVAYVRLGSANGVTVASGAGARYNANVTQLRALIPTFGDEGTKPLSPASQYATVPANELATLVVVIAREGNANTWAASNEDASLTVWAIPV